MLNDEKQSPAIHPAVPAKLAHFTPNAKPGLDWEGSSLNLIDHAAELIRASEQRASHAEEIAEKVSAKAAEAVRAAQLRIEQTQAHARLLEQHAAEQVKLAHERIAKAEALAHERVEQAQASAQEGIERAQAAESRLRAAEARASDAEERFEQLNQALRRKLSAAAPQSPATHKARCLN
jgi:GTPase Era involved in 16S rRNA processing